MTTNYGISIRALAPLKAPPWLTLSAPLLDRLLGIRAMDRLYRRNKLENLPPFDFIEQGLAMLDIKLESTPVDISNRIPATGPLLIVCNHPHGGVEALALAQELKSVRTDIKFLANTGLQVFRELQPLLITTNPLKVSQKNLSSIRQCETHLRSGGVLIVFPAGKVSFQHPGEERIRDRHWNRLIGHLAKRTSAPLLPVFFSGNNSPLFHKLGKIWDRSKMLLLPRELLGLRGKTVAFIWGHIISADAWRHLDAGKLTRYARLMTYMLEDNVEAKQIATDSQLAPLAAMGDPVIIEAELAGLPGKQRLLDFKQYSVFYARAAQIPYLMKDIARERERVFRLHDEGSGEARDGDEFDRSYVQLFTWDNSSHSLVGAYRFGQTDLLRQQGSDAIYLTQMFDFDEAFYKEMPPALELGRSFVVPEHQKSFHSLYLLWRGIGCYLAAHPQYRRLYGTVSLSRQYDDKAIALLCDALIEPSPYVRPKQSLTKFQQPEWSKFKQDFGMLDLQTVSACVRGTDREGKDIPVLLGLYHKLGAKFHCVAVDPNFNNTPGLLLMVDMDSAPEKLVTNFLGIQATEYLAFNSAGRQASRE
ncbi:MAG: lysophospholipid acyltransferase family protein [Proteobacteria bacterium]|nr:lysophospholipid acyltransferase family protein [Pseudomonadota bacterium]